MRNVQKNKKQNNRLFLVSHFSFQEGFTLIEMLAVIAVFATIGTVILSTIFISLRSSSKSDSITAVRQNGNFALSQIVKGVRYAKELDDPYPCTPLPTPTPMPTYTSLTVTNLDDSQTTFSCTTGDSGTIKQDDQPLVDEGAVKVISCVFTCMRATTSDPPSLDISFSLAPAKSSGSAEASAVIPFETSVTLRNVAE